MNLVERLKALLTEAEESPDSADTPAEPPAQYSQADLDAAIERALQKQQTRPDPAETRPDPAETRPDPAENGPQYSQADLDAAIERALQKQPKPVVVPQPGHASASGDPDVSAMTQQEKAKYAATLDEKNRGQRISM